MDISIQVTLDIDSDFEKAFLSWLNDLNNSPDTKKQRVKDAVLTGYFIVERGINEYYKRYFEKDFKSICELELQERVAKVTEERDVVVRKMNATLDSAFMDHERKLEMMTKSNLDLQQQIVKMQEDRELLKQETMHFYDSKAKKEIELIQLDNEARVKDLEYKLQRAREETDTYKVSSETILDTYKERDVKYMQDKYDGEIRAIKDQCKVMEEQVLYFKTLAADKDMLLREAFKNDTQERIHSLETLVQQKDAELSTLKTCNFVKGFTGENIILSFLREHYSKHDIFHTGKVAHEGDIQMIDTTDDSLIVVESKYKQAIDKNDVEKFCRDVSNVCQKEGAAQCVGGIFVSLLTRNIPGKGDAHFEMIGHVPVMYVGFSNINEFNVYFKKYMEMFLTLSKFYKAQGAKRSDVGDFIDEMNFYFNMLIKNKTRIEDFKTNCLTKLNKFVGDIESDNKMILTRIEDMLKKNNALKYNNMHSCERCGEVFSQKRLLTKHIKTCS